MAEDHSGITRVHEILDALDQHKRATKARRTLELELAKALLEADLATYVYVDIGGLRGELGRI